MRLLAKLATARPLRLSIVRAGALALGGALLALAGPALGGRDAPAVWVPPAPAGLDSGAAPAPAAGTPTVLVPFQSTVAVPQAGPPPAPWVPHYLAAPAAGAQAQAGPVDKAHRAGLLPEAPAPGGTAAKPAKGAPVTFSDVLRDVEWRRATAERLRTRPGFQPRF